MAERKPISQKLRFEVFKRDNFTCQYCGRKAPDVVLEVDHIKPVASGGKNVITNLITSCYECNRGKGKRELSNNLEVEKKQVQLELLNERRKQIQMIAKWEEELLKIEDEQVSIIDKMLMRYGRYFNETGRNDVKKIIKKCGLQEVIECFNISFAQYYNPNDENSIYKAINYIFRIAETRYNQKQNPYMREVNYLLKLVRDKYPHLSQYQYGNVKDIISSMMKLSYNSDNFDNLFDKIKRLIYCRFSKADFIEELEELYNTEMF